MQVGCECDKIDVFRTGAGSSTIVIINAMERELGNGEGESLG